MTAFSGRAAALAIVAFAATPALAADPVEDFYKGRQITFLVSTEPGTPYDAYARTLGQFLPDHIPGKPTIVMQNMVGAGGIRATNHLANNAPKDGTVIAAVHSAIPTAPLLAPAAVQYDSRKMGWIGSVTKEVYMGYVWTATAPAQTFEESKQKQNIMGGITVGTTSVDLSIVSNELFGTKFKIVTGYKSSPEAKLAMEKGEIHGVYGNAYTSLKLEQPDWLRDKKVKIIIQHGFTKHKDLPDVPLLVDQAKTPEDRALLDVLLARQETGKPVLAGPDLPPERLAALRKGFDETVKDPRFVVQLEKIGLSMEEPMGGAQVAELATKLAGTSRDVVKRLEGILAKFSEGK
jgi:tripartite-type tricarboxylate transporter receptor subunit TctC